MQNRRRFLQGSLTLPWIEYAVKARAAIPRSSSVEILSDRCCLSQESAAGYRKATIAGAREIVIAAGLRNMSHAELRQLRSRANRGAWLIWERAASFTDVAVGEYDKRFAEVFGLEARLRPSPIEALYVRYHLPEAALVRRMGTLPRFSHPAAQIIATCEGEPCGFSQAIGAGGFVYLGSMLGPQLAVGDKAAETLLTRLLSSSKA